MAFTVACGGGGVIGSGVTVGSVVEVGRGVSVIVADGMTVAVGGMGVADAATVAVGGTGVVDGIGVVDGAGVEEEGAVDVGSSVAAKATTPGVAVGMVVTKPLGRASVIPVVAVIMMIYGVWVGGIVVGLVDVVLRSPPRKILLTTPKTINTRKMFPHPRRIFFIDTSLHEMIYAEGLAYRPAVVRNLSA